MTDQDVEWPRDLQAIRTELTRFMMSYKFATDEMMTKVNILKEEFSSIPTTARSSTSATA